MYCEIVLGAQMRYHFEDCTLDTDRRELRRPDGARSVEPQVFDLLEFLIQNRDRVVSRDALIEAIGDTGEEQRLIKTFPRKGVRFVGAVREEAANSAAAASRAERIALPEKPRLQC